MLFWIVPAILAVFGLIPLGFDRRKVIGFTLLGTIGYIVLLMVVENIWWIRTNYFAVHLGWGNTGSGGRSGLMNTQFLAGFGLWIVIAVMLWFALIILGWGRRKVTGYLFLTTAFLFVASIAHYLMYGTMSMLF